MSRIWKALKQAERERARAGTFAPPNVPSIEAPMVEEAGPESVSDWAPPEPADDPERRQGLRHSHEVVLMIYGANSDKQPFHEESATVDANENGCLLTLENVVSRGQRLFLTNTRNQAEQECRVVYIGRRTAGKARVGVEFLQPSLQFWRLQ